MSSVRVTTNFKDNNGTDLGDKLVTKDYLISVYPEIGDKIGIPPELFTWGGNKYGRLGTDNTSNRFTPVTTFAGGTNWKQVSAGGGHTAAIKTNGTLWTWGGGLYGRLGINATTDRSTPVTTRAGGTNWKQVSAGNAHTAAIKTNGTLWTWGYNGSGQLGINATTNRNTPVQVFGSATNWKQVIAASDHTAAVKTDGTLWTWGYGGNGRLGTNATIQRNTPVTTFAGGTNWKQVSSGNFHMAAVKTDGTLWTWGNGGNGQLGTNAIITISTPVTTFAGGTNWKQVSSGTDYTAAVKTDGTLWTWGSGGLGRLGTNDGITRSTPVTTFAGGINWKQVSAGTTGSSHIAAIKTDGTLWTWGNGGSGRLGNAVTTNVSTPVTTFAGGTNWKQVSSGASHTAAIKSVDFTTFQ
jgi:alpha-tubulin suppressor-like RCC1 family protein